MDNFYYVNNCDLLFFFFLLTVAGVVYTCTSASIVSIYNRDLPCGVNLELLLLI